MSIIEAKKINRTRGQGSLAKNILIDIDVSIGQGEFVAIMGKSGAGKSTLLHQLAALDVPTSGEVLVEGQSIHNFNEAELIKLRLYTFGYVFQDYALIKDLSAIENIQVPLLMRGLNWSESRAKAKEVIDLVGLVDRYNNLPTQLSGGEQQRVSVARAIVGSPRILFADEPTANLDSASGQAIISLLNDLHKNGQTIVMVTHEKEYTAWCDRVINLEDGKIVSEVLLKEPVNLPKEIGSDILSQ